jgi:phage tail sheath protein FI
MPVMPDVNYPGVYIQEVESEVHTIVPVETATTAFIGRALRGPVNQPIVINSFADFQRIFGGLWLESNLGYAVSQFFLNGGSKAIIVRLYNPPTGETGKANIKINDMTLTASNPGAWGNNLCVRITDVDDKVKSQLSYCSRQKNWCD